MYRLFSSNRSGDCNDALTLALKARTVGFYGATVNDSYQAERIASGK